MSYCPICDSDLKPRVLGIIVIRHPDSKKLSDQEWQANKDTTHGLQTRLWINQKNTLMVCPDCTYAERWS